MLISGICQGPTRLPSSLNPRPVMFLGYTIWALVANLHSFSAPSIHAAHTMLFGSSSITQLSHRDHNLTKKLSWAWRGYRLRSSWSMHWDGRSAPIWYMKFLLKNSENKSRLLRFDTTYMLNCIHLHPIKTNYMYHRKTATFDTSVKRFSLV